MATTDALKGKNALITAASMVGAVALEFLLERRAGGAKQKVSDAVGKLPGKSPGDLMDDLGRGVSSVAKKATNAVRGDSDDDDRGDDAEARSDDGDERGLDELTERRRQREERRQRRRQAS